MVKVLSITSETHRQCLDYNNEVQQGSLAAEVLAFPHSQESYMVLAWGWLMTQIANFLPTSIGIPYGHYVPSSSLLVAWKKNRAWPKSLGSCTCMETQKKLLVSDMLSFAPTGRSFSLSPPLLCNFDIPIKIN